MYSSGVAVSFQGMMTTPTTPVISAPVRKLTIFGARFARSYAGDTTLAAMFTETVAISTVALIIAGRLAPRSPNEARASTGNGMPYFGPACPVSSIGNSTIRLASAIVKTACFQSMPSVTRLEASSQDGMLCAMPTQSAAKLYVVQLRRATGTGSRSALAKRLSSGPRRAGVRRGPVDRPSVRPARRWAVRSRSWRRDPSFERRGDWGHRTRPCGRVGQAVRAGGSDRRSVRAGRADGPAVCRGRGQG